MLLLPIAAAIVAVIFAVSTWRAAGTSNVALRVWSFALLQFAIASAALAWGVGFGWTPVAYRFFYLFGAVLNVAWLGLGTVWLLGNLTAARIATAVVIGASMAAATMIVLGPLAPGAQTALATADIPRASAVVPAEVRVMSRVFSIGGSVVLLGGLLSSLVRRRRAAGLALLAAGVVIAGVASELGRMGNVAPFSIGLAVAIAVMYAGFVRTT